MLKVYALSSIFVQVLVCSIKGEVKKKHSCTGWNFCCFAAHLIEQDLL
jgi:hypothetical protein